jgi:hypothetical protein
LKHFLQRSYALNTENKNNFSESLKKEAGGDEKHFFFTRPNQKLDIIASSAPGGSQV